MFPLYASIKVGKFSVVNILIILTTIFVFIQQVSAPGPEAFINHYAFIPYNLNLGNLATLYPLVTAIFLHGGFFHILTNMWFLWVFGRNVEGYFGHFFYLILYIFSGVVGNIVQYFIDPTSTIPVLGASGAIAGVLGAYFILFPFAKIKTLIIFFGFITIINISAGFILGYWFILQILSGATSLPFMGNNGGVAFFAHIGGFIAGIIVAKLFPRRNNLIPMSEF